MSGGENKPRYDGSEVAIVGMAGRFPGAGSVDDFWHHLQEGVEGISRFSHEDLEAEGIDPALAGEPSWVGAGGVLDGIDRFDARFFGYNPREAELIDPQQRLFLEQAWQALEHAGYDPSVYDGLVGVFASSNLSGYLLSNLYSHRELVTTLAPLQTQMGNDKDYLATRVSFKLGLTGPSFTVQTACSSSLVAVHLARQSLLQEECDMAIAGGVSIRVPQRTGYLYQEEGILSPDGRCRPFDENAAGTVFSNGVAVVVLKRLADAVRDGDTLYAVIRGSAVNNDGALKVGFTAPSVEGQSAVIAEALAEAGVEPHTVSYVEAHGTGTALGDPIEVAALRRAFGDGLAPGSCALGSVKSNIGHLSMAAGVTSLIKTALMLRHRTLVPSLHFAAPNPKCGLEGSPFRINTRLQPWPAQDGPRRAGVSSFGLGGTNAHVVLEEPPELRPSPEPVRAWNLLVLSARTATALETATANLADHLRTRPDLPAADVAFTSQVGRKAFSHRRMLLHRDLGEAAELLETLDPKRVFTVHQERRDRPVVFLFPGQGSQYPGMTREIHAGFPAFRKELDRCAEILRPRLGLDLRELIFPAEGTDAEAAAARLEQTAVAQPALFAVEYSLARLWMELGITPAAMIGHSVGEYAAACLAGVFTLEEALGLVAERGRLMQSMPPGAMLAVTLPEEKVLPLLGSGLSLAAVNGPARCVVSGPVPAVEDLEARLTSERVEHRRLHTSHAFHSGMLEPVLEPFARELAKVKLRAPRLPFLSNLTGAGITAAEATAPGYWLRQVRETVRFAEGLRELDREPDWIFLEVGPGRTLSGLARQQGGRSAERITLSSLRHPRDEGSDLELFLTTVGRLWLAGAPVSWQGLRGGERRRRVALPTYPFERERHWIEPRREGLAGGLQPMARAGWQGSELENETPATEAPAQSRGHLHSPYEAPRTDAEREVAAIWGRSFGIRDVGIHDDFFELGGDSLLATQIASALREAFRVELGVRTLFEAPNVAELAARIEEIRGAAHEEVEPTEILPREGELLPGLEQERLWLLSRLEAGNPAHHIPAAFRIRGPLEPAVLAACLDEIGRRHEALRLTFAETGGRLRAAVSPARPWALPVLDLRGLPEIARAAELRRVAAGLFRAPFDLESGPLMRAALVEQESDERALLLVLHHVIADARSIEILLRELAALYPAFAQGRPSPLSEPRVQYLDFAAWQRRRLEGEVLESQLAAWREVLSGELPVLALPSDRPRPEVQSFRGGHLPVTLPGELWQRVKDLSRRAGTTPFTVLLAGFQVWLSRLSGQDDLVVGSPVANRPRPELEGLIGLFANILALRTRLPEDPTFRAVVDLARSGLLEAWSRQDVPFARVVEAVQPERARSHNPVFQAMFSFLETAATVPEIPGLELAPLFADSGASAFDLFLTLAEEEGEVRGQLAYSADLFDAATAAHLLERFRETLEAAIAQPETPFSQIPVLARQTIAVAATFTADPVREPLAFWMRQLGMPSRIELAPYDQVFQELLDPGSLLGSNRAGVNLLLVRPEDWQREGEGDGIAIDTSPPALERAERNARELASVLRAAVERSATPYLLFLCPGSPAAEADPERRAFAERVEALLAAELEGRLGGVYLVPTAEVLSAYPVVSWYDAGRDRLGHIPYTPVFFAALATLAARRIHALRTPPFKVIALDADQTLWQGVCGEDGPQGIVIDAPRRALQELMVAQQEAGRLLCVCSKNVEEDVAAVFDQRPDMPLKRDHVTAWRVNWQPKSGNLRSLAAELQLGLDSFLFVDDNPVEWVEVQAGCPAVVTVRLPQDVAAIPDFLRRFWGFDHLRVTDEDRRRTAMYRQSLGREQARRESSSLTDFLSRLELDVRIFTPREDNIPRVSQLTQRTNQFNTTTLRRSEPEVRQLAASGREALAVEVSDRFGHYGLVGVVVFGPAGEALEVDSLLLSCRVLGRGVEHRILARLGEIARGRGLARVDVRFVRSARNKPAHDFLIKVAGPFRDGADEEAVFRIPAGEAIAAPSRLTSETVAEEVPEDGGKPVAALSAPPASAAWRTTLLNRIATELSSPERVLAWVEPPRRQRASAGYEAPRNEVESLLAGLWAEALRLERVGIHDSFFDLGGHSLLGTQLVARLQEVFGLQIPLHQLFTAPTVAGMAACLAGLREQGGAGAPALERVARDGRLPLSFAQKRLWALHLLDPDSPRHNIPIAFRLSGSLDVAALRASLQAIVDRHEVLRATFDAPDGQPVHVLHEGAELVLPRIDLADLPEAARAAEAARLARAEARRPFHLDRDLLMRATLVRLGPAEHDLLITFHHVVADGWSLGVLERELVELYTALATGRPARLPELPVQYVDFAAWQELWLQAGIEEHLSWWKERLAGAPPLLALPTDRPRPAVQSLRGAVRTVSFPEPLSRAVEELGRREGATTFMTLLAAWTALLHRHAGQDDILVGTPVSHRNRPETAGLIGLFMDALVMRTGLGDDPTFRELLARVRQGSLEAYAHQDVPFSKVAEAVRTGRSRAYNPVFQVMFSYLDLGMDERALPGLRLAPLFTERGSTDFDLFLTVVGGGTQLRGSLEYCADLFDPETVDRMLRDLGILLQAVVESPDLRLSQLPLLGAAERTPDPRLEVVVTATFTARPLEEPLGFWLEETGVPAGIRFAPYAQVFQELLQPASLTAANRQGVNLLLVRPEDWAGASGSPDRPAALRQSVGQLLDILTLFRQRNAGLLLLVLCPPSRAALGDAPLRNALAEEGRRLAARVAALPGVELLDGAAIAALYEVGDPDDPRSDELGHIPYTPEYFAALAAAVTRRLAALAVPGPRALAADAAAVLGRGPEAAALRELLLRQAGLGRRISLVSRRSERELKAALQRAPGLQALVPALRAGRRPLAEKLQSLSQELCVPLAELAWIGCDPDEHEALRAACPETLALLIPKDASQVPLFLDHVWALDGPASLATVSYEGTPI